MTMLQANVLFDSHNGMALLLYQQRTQTKTKLTPLEKRNQFAAKNSFFSSSRLFCIDYTIGGHTAISVFILLLIFCVFRQFHRVDSPNFIGIFLDGTVCRKDAGTAHIQPAFAGEGHR